MHATGPSKNRGDPTTLDSKSEKISVRKLFTNMMDMKPMRPRPSFLVSQYHLSNLSRQISEDLNDNRTSNSEDDITPTVAAAFTEQSTLRNQSASGRTSKTDSRSGISTLLYMTSETQNRQIPMNLVSLASDSTENIGCNRPIRLIHARANERTRRQTQASFTREQGDASHLEAITRGIQEKFQREAREITLRDNCIKRKFWQKMIALSFAQMQLTVRLPQQLKEASDIMSRNRAAVCIQTTYRNHKLKRFDKLSARIAISHPWFKDCFTFQVSVGYFIQLILLSALIISRCVRYVFGGREGRLFAWRISWRLVPNAIRTGYVADEYNCSICHVKSHSESTKLLEKKKGFADVFTHPFLHTVFRELCAAIHAKCKIHPAAR